MKATNSALYGCNCVIVEPGDDPVRVVNFATEIGAEYTDLEGESQIVAQFPGQEPAPYTSAELFRHVKRLGEAHAAEMAVVTTES
ncbi:MAG: hypothetical protein COV10_01660 [Candidatus Vogelbacteria bacterium CG10_big_fil_rev_8_21_14_0_10_51_16]|uniref:Uncharacterized protein n=1 Tax=Candidatus Vogelbacteria bacterium CG10_big_fil_rev_8_21_14_0_10_51_16 TaxID=1975045 RepID=A0A2H0REN8_9BACT|nr:MAG: hypothetical protein COV10_01660 [Candidatus Vogelbacteria bacterium CG10_big_fil_rev_8_21_14_0_10_51_16]